MNIKQIKKKKGEKKGEKENGMKTSRSNKFRND